MNFEEIIYLINARANIRNKLTNLFIHFDRLDGKNTYRVDFYF